MKHPREGADELLGDLARRQSNIQPHDIIRNDRSVDDVFWNGPTRDSGVQRAGILIFGLFFILGGLSIASAVSGKDGAWMGYFVGLLFVAAGFRLIYKSSKVRRKERKSR